MPRKLLVCLVVCASCNGVIGPMPDSGSGGGGAFDSGSTGGGSGGGSAATGGGVAGTGGGGSLGGGTGGAGAGGGNDAGFDAGEPVDSGTDAGTTGAGFDAGVGRTIFVIGGQDQRRMFSLDGQTWQHDIYVAPNGLDDAFGAIAVGARIIVAAGDPGLYTSLDGITWTQTLPTQLHGAATVYGGGYFVMVKGDLALKSADGLTWMMASNTGNSGHWQSVAYGNGHYVAFGDGYKKTSEDGLAWHDFSASADPDPFAAVAFGNGVFVAVGKKSSMGRSATSTDGVTFTDSPLVATSYSTGFAGVAFGNGRFVTNDCCNAFESTDGVSWTKRSTGHGAGIVFAGGKFVASGWRTEAYLYDEDAGAFGNTFGGDQPNIFPDAGIAPWFTGLGAGEIN